MSLPNRLFLFKKPERHRISSFITATRNNQFDQTEVHVDTQFSAIFGNLSGL